MAAERRPRGENEYGPAFLRTQAGRTKWRSAPLLGGFGYGLPATLRGSVGGFRYPIASDFGFPNSSGCTYLPWSAFGFGTITWVGFAFAYRSWRMPVTSQDTFTFGWSVRMVKRLCRISFHTAAFASQCALPTAVSW